MRRTALVALVLILATACATGPARLDEPIVLGVGETREAGPDGFAITLRSVADDSGCVTSSDCSTMIFNGSIVALANGKNHLMQISAVLRPGSAVKLDADGYPFELREVQRDGANRFRVTFVVHGRAKP